MAGSPFGPWAKRLGPADPNAKPVPASTLPDVLGEVAQLYRAFFPTVTPLELDRMELWQIAVLLGLDEMPSGGIQGGVPSRPLPPQSAAASEVASGPRLRAVR